MPGGAKVITITDRKLNIGHADRIVGYTGDNRVEVRIFELVRYYDNLDMSAFDFKLDTEISGVKNIIDLDKVVNGDKITLTWEIAESHLLHTGRMAIQLRAFSSGEEKWHSAQDFVLVQASINATAVQPSPLPSEFEQMEVRITLAKNEAQEAEQGALGQANRAQGIADEFENETLPAAIAAGQAQQEDGGAVWGACHDTDNDPGL